MAVTLAPLLWFASHGDGGAQRLAPQPPGKAAERAGLSRASIMWNPNFLKEKKERKEIAYIFHICVVVDLNRFAGKGADTQMKLISL